MNAKVKNVSPKVGSERESFLTTEEKAQYEVFKNGKLPRETIEQWIKNDFNTIRSFIHGCMSDPVIFQKIVDVFFERYQKLHEAEKEVFNDKS